MIEKIVDYIAFLLIIVWSYGLPISVCVSSASFKSRSTDASSSYIGALL